MYVVRPGIGRSGGGGDGFATPVSSPRGNTAASSSTVHMPSLVMMRPISSSYASEMAPPET